MSFLFGCWLTIATSFFLSQVQFLRVPLSSELLFNPSMNEGVIHAAAHIIIRGYKVLPQKMAIALFAFATCSFQSWVPVDWSGVLRLPKSINGGVICAAIRLSSQGLQYVFGIWPLC